MLVSPPCGGYVVLVCSMSLFWYSSRPYSSMPIPRGTVEISGAYCIGTSIASAPSGKALQQDILITGDYGCGIRTTLYPAHLVLGGNIEQCTKVHLVLCSILYIEPCRTWNT